MVNLPELNMFNYVCHTFLNTFKNRGSMVAKSEQTRQKVAEAALRQRRAKEVKYVRAVGQPLPETVVEAEHYLLSPAFAGEELDRPSLDWCIQLCRDNPRWRLSVQQHKGWKVR